MQAHGVASLKTFVTDLLNTTGKGQLHDTLPKLQLRTISPKKKRLGAASAKINEIKSTRNMFGRLLVIGRNLSMKSHLQYPLGSLPLSIATPTGGYSPWEQLDHRCYGYSAFDEGSGKSDLYTAG